MIKVKRFDIFQMALLGRGDMTLKNQTVNQHLCCCDFICQIYRILLLCFYRLFTKMFADSEQNEQKNKFSGNSEF